MKKQEFKRTLISILIGSAIGIPLSLFALDQQQERKEAAERYIIEHYEQYEQIPEPEGIIRWKQEN